MSKVFYEMKVFDKDMNLKYIVPASEVEHRHVAAVERNPEQFPSGEYGPQKVKLKMGNNCDGDASSLCENIVEIT